jgi:hypothetical protein
MKQRFNLRFACDIHQCGMTSLHCRWHEFCSLDLFIFVCVSLIWCDRYGWFPIWCNGDSLSIVCFRHTVEISVSRSLGLIPLIISSVVTRFEHITNFGMMGLPSWVNTCEKLTSNMRLLSQHELYHWKVLNTTDLSVNMTAKEICRTNDSFLDHAYLKGPNIGLGLVTLTIFLI